MRAVVDLLAETDLAHNQATRELLIGAFGRRGGGRLYVPEFPVARDWVFFVVQECAEIDGGIEILVDAIEELRPGARVLRPLRRLVDVRAAAAGAAAAGALWADLERDLSRPGTIVGPAARAFREACHPEPLPDHCETSWDLLVRAAGRQHTGHGLPPYQVYLVRCADLLRMSTWVEVEQWLRARAFASGLVRELNQVLLGRENHALLSRVGEATDRDCVLAIQFTPDARPSAEPDHVASWRMYWDGESPLRVGERQRVRPEEFEELTGSLVTIAEELFDAEAREDEVPELVVQVLLPHLCLDLPVTSWRRRVDGANRLLVHDYPVIVGCVERAQRRWAPLEWKRRWAAIFAAQPPTLTPVMAANHGMFGLARVEEGNAVVLSGPPSPGSTAQAQLFEALRAGFPVAAWEHPDPRRPTGHTALLLMLAGDPRDLPRRFRQENLTRLDASNGHQLAASPDEFAQQAIRHAATLLLEPPVRIAPRGGGEPRPRDDDSDGAPGDSRDIGA